ncbi:MAG: putative oligopeptide transport protein superfamily, atp bind [Rhodospirillales bacterium]|nr:putative oligopeptide transport protein superfamily, atp bind [Rhodospirillales bacterium]
MSEHLISVMDLHVGFSTRRGAVKAVRGISFELVPGATLGVVGESGSGKSVTAYAITRLLDRAGEITSGQVSYFGRNLGSLTEAEMRRLRGSAISMIFQNPRAALNPIRCVGQQIADALNAHGRLTRAEQRERTLQLLRDVMLTDVERIFRSYPHELSGGMCQRIMIALAIACEPKLLIADEATTGLDVTTQKVVMDLLSSLVAERGMGLILITHDLGLAARYCGEIAVMREGQIVEKGAVDTIFGHPRHEYTKRLIAASPTADSTIEDLVPEGEAERFAAPAPMKVSGAPLLLEVRNLSKNFSGFAAVSDVSFTLAAGESLGLVGESGSGKSTISRIVTRLLDKTAGEISFKGESIGEVPATRFNSHRARRDIQIVFQDPHESLNPRYTAFDSIAHPLRTLEKSLPREELNRRVRECADRVGFPAELLTRFPHQLSGGQKARIGIARAIATRPSLLVLDEPTAALDVSVQAIVLRLLDNLRKEGGLAFLFVSHDLNVVRMLCDRVVVLQAGKVVEAGRAADVFMKPTSEYTRTLLQAVPSFSFRARAKVESPVEI